MMIPQPNDDEGCIRVYEQSLVVDPYDRYACNAALPLSPTCTGTATGGHAGKTCDLDATTNGAATCWTGCVAADLSGDVTASTAACTATARPAATCTGTATATATATCTGTQTSSTADCAVNAAWTGGDYSVGSCATTDGCTYVAAVVQTCDLDAATDSMATCPAGCAETVAVGAGCAYTPASCTGAATLVAATCTGTATGADAAKVCDCISK